MILPDYLIIRHLQDRIEPFDRSMIQPASIDVRLSNIFQVLDNSQFPHAIDPAQDNSPSFDRVPIPRDGYFTLNPHTFALASTVEKFTMPEDLAGRFEGKSSLGRLGLLTHITAGFIDPGFQGHITLELSNVTNRPIKLYPGMKIGQMCFIKMDGAVSTPYGMIGLGSHYQGQSEPQISKSHENFYIYRPEE